MPDEPTAAFWARCKASLRLDHDRRHITAFGDSAGMKTELAALVAAGRKRATAGIGDDVAVGDLSVVVDGADEPVCVIRTTELRTGPLNSVDAAFAWDEGEGDRSLGHWLDAHRAYFERQAASEGRPFRDDVEVVFERFTVVFPLELADR